jgi:hypothetical protein
VGDQLRARGFNQRKVPVHDSSGWTETPADRARKADEAKVGRSVRDTQRSAAR